MQAGDNIIWLCSSCKGNIKSIKNENKALKTEVESLRRENDLLKDRLFNIEYRLELGQF